MEIGRNIWYTVGCDVDSGDKVPATVARYYLSTYEINILEDV